LLLEIQKAQIEMQTRHLRGKLERFPVLSDCLVQFLLYVVRFAKQDVNEDGIAVRASQARECGGSFFLVVLGLAGLDESKKDALIRPASGSSRIPIQIVLLWNGRP
jgi:hypothetical protein